MRILFLCRCRRSRIFFRNQKEFFLFYRLRKKRKKRQISSFKSPRSPKKRKKRNISGLWFPNDENEDENYNLHFRFQKGSKKNPKNRQRCTINLHWFLVLNTSKICSRKKIWTIFSERFSTESHKWNSPFLVNDSSSILMIQFQNHTQEYSCSLEFFLCLFFVFSFVKQIRKMIFFWDSRKNLSLNSFALLQSFARASFWPIKTQTQTLYMKVMSRLQFSKSNIPCMKIKPKNAPPPTSPNKQKQKNLKLSNSDMFFSTVQNFKRTPKMQTKIKREKKEKEKFLLVIFLPFSLDSFQKNNFMFVVHRERERERKAKKLWF